MVRIIPKTVTADTAATPNARFLFFSIFFSSFNLDSKSVTLTLPSECEKFERSLLRLRCVLTNTSNQNKLKFKT